MIRLASVTLPAEILDDLAELQGTIDRLPAYSEQVDGAKRLFASRNVRGNRTFDAVKAHLDQMCSGARRCGYCEDSCADEVEHIWPKSLYPGRTFVWDNYLYACGPCNSPKGDDFAIHVAGNGRRVQVNPGRGRLRVTPPPHGHPLLIDPRHEDPLDFLILDLQSTFRFLPLGRRPSKPWQRANYTIEVLHLNDRDPLIRARRSAFNSFKWCIGDYIRRRDSQEPQHILDSLTAALRTQAHQTVWREMQRQHDLNPELHQLFAVAPEALNW